MFKFPIGMNNVHIGGGEGGVKALISNFSNFSSLIFLVFFPTLLSDFLVKIRKLVQCPLHISEI